MGGTNNGVYPINPDGQGMIHVYCDQTSEDGGWIFLQHRSSPFNMSFFRDWNSYKNGFGVLDGEHWLGNDAIHRITTTPRKLAIQLESSDGDSVQIYYLNFTVSHEDENYRMDYSAFTSQYNETGNAFDQNKGASFSTRDRDNDGNNLQNCASIKKSAWWFISACGHSDLNQKEYPLWDTWYQYQKVSKSTMKIR